MLEKSPDIKDLASDQTDQPKPRKSWQKSRAERWAKREARWNEGWDEPRPREVSVGTLTFTEAWDILAKPGGPGWGTIVLRRPRRRLTRKNSFHLGWSMAERRLSACEERALLSLQEQALHAELLRALDGELPEAIAEALAQQAPETAPAPEDLTAA